MPTTSLLPDVGIELREGNAEVGDVSLHYVEAGDRRAWGGVNRLMAAEIDLRADGRSVALRCMVRSRATRLAPRTSPRAEQPHVQAREPRSHGSWRIPRAERAARDHVLHAP
jgi:hypothetical protein